MAESKTVVSTLAGQEVKKESVVRSGDMSKVEIVPVTIQPETESAAIIYKSTAEILEIAYKLQRGSEDSYENPSQHQRDALQDASVMFLKYKCQQAISQWDQLITKLTKLTKYKNMGRPEIEKTAKANPKFAGMYTRMQEAVEIKSRLK
jgi:hypothetical protein